MWMRFRRIYCLCHATYFISFISRILIWLMPFRYLVFWLWNWGNEAVFLCSIFRLWPYLIVLHGSLQAVAQMFSCSASFSMVSLASTNLLWYFGAGISFGMMSFASASEKFIPVFISALVYHLSGGQVLPWIVYKLNILLILVVSAFRVCHIDLLGFGINLSIK